MPSTVPSDLFRASTFFDLAERKITWMAVILDVAPATLLARATPAMTSGVWRK